MKVTFERVLEYLKDAGERGVPLHPGFPPTAKERLAQDQLAILTAISEQIEANRLAIKELRLQLESLGLHLEVDNDEELGELLGN